MLFTLIQQIRLLLFQFPMLDQTIKHSTTEGKTLAAFRVCVWGGGGGGAGVVGGIIYRQFNFEPTEMGGRGGGGGGGGQGN